MYLRFSTLIRKRVIKNILSFAFDVTFFIANVSDFTRILLVKVKKFELSYIPKKISYSSTFR